MDKKQLQISLSKLEQLQEKNVTLEQYQLEGNLAAEILWKAFLNGDIENKIVADLGCGNGILGTGALLLSAKKVCFLDIDNKSLELAKKNSSEQGIYLLQDISQFNKKVDTIIMNPPFGVQQKKADKPFLEKAMQTATAIYSLHKIESKAFIQQLAKENNFTVEEILEREFILKKTYAFHKKKHYPVKVGIWTLRKA